VKLSRVGFNAQKVGVKKKRLRRKEGEQHDEDGGACVTMQGTFQRVRMNALEMPAREMKASDSPGKLWLSNNARTFQYFRSKNVCYAACVSIQSIQDIIVLDARVERCLHHNTNASVVTS
jgi:hypothetical protein